jgi:hypothetical protein
MDDEDYLTPEERAAEARLAIIIYRIAKWAVFVLIATLLIGILSSCATKERIVPVPEIHDHWHYHTDSVHHTDSIIHEKETTIMQLDSAAMAKYGITLQKAERAWLVKTAELQRQIERLEAMSIQKDSVRDSIPYPVEVIKEVPAELSWWQGLLVRLGYCSLGIVIIYLIYLKFKR